MTFLEQLQAHKGGLVRLKTELYWYGSRGRDGTPGRICLLLDADAATATSAHSPAAGTKRITTAADTALLLVDGAPHWVWVVEADTELL
jgi:hypothetical protein